jgi:hypothetical protein
MQTQMQIPTIDSISYTLLLQMLCLVIFQSFTLCHHIVFLVLVHNVGLLPGYRALPRLDIHPIGGKISPSTFKHSHSMVTY